MEAVSPVAPFKQRRVRIDAASSAVSLKDPRRSTSAFPPLKNNKVLDFTELFQGFAVKKSRVVKRPLQCMCFYVVHSLLTNVRLQWNRSTPRRGTVLILIIDDRNQTRTRGKDRLVLIRPSPVRVRVQFRNASLARGIEINGKHLRKFFDAKWTHGYGEAMKETMGHVPD